MTFLQTHTKTFLDFSVPFHFVECNTNSQQLVFTSLHLAASIQQVQNSYYTYYNYQTCFRCHTKAFTSFESVAVGCVTYHPVQNELSYLYWMLC